MKQILKALIQNAIPNAKSLVTWFVEPKDTRAEGRPASLNHRVAYFRALKTNLVHLPP